MFENTPTSLPKQKRNVHAEEVKGVGGMDSQSVHSSMCTARIQGSLFCTIRVEWSNGNQIHADTSVRKGMSGTKTYTL